MSNSELRINQIGMLKYIIITCIIQFPFNSTGQLFITELYDPIVISNPDADITKKLMSIEKIEQVNSFWYGKYDMLLDQNGFQQFKMVILDEVESSATRWKWKCILTDSTTDYEEHCYATETVYMNYKRRSYEIQCSYSGIHVKWRNIKL